MKKKIEGISNDFLDIPICLKIRVYEINIVRFIIVGERIAKR